MVKTVNLMLCVILQFKREKKLEWGGRETLPSLALLWGAGEVSRKGPGYKFRDRFIDSNLSSTPEDLCDLE